MGQPERCDGMILGMVWGILACPGG